MTWSSGWSPFWVIYLDMWLIFVPLICNNSVGHRPTIVRTDVWAAFSIPAGQHQDARVPTFSARLAPSERVLIPDGGGAGAIFWRSYKLWLFQNGSSFYFLLKTASYTKYLMDLLRRILWRSWSWSRVQVRPNRTINRTIGAVLQK
jgi:hypothetical protein